MAAEKNQDIKLIEKILAMAVTVDCSEVQYGTQDPLLLYPVFHLRQLNSSALSGQTVASYPEVCVQN